MTINSKKVKETAGIWFILAIFTAAFAFSVHRSSGQSSVRSAVWEPFRSMAQLKMPRWFGSGTLVAVGGGKGLVLSCRHVAYKVGNEVKLKWVSVGLETTGKVVEVIPRTGGRRRGSSWQNDLALVEAYIPAGLKPIPVVKFDPDNGPWTCLGFRGETAYIAVTNKAKKKGDSIVLSALFWGGESGGAVLDKYGHLVGVIVASDGNNGSTGIAANGEALQAMLEKYGKQY